MKRLRMWMHAGIFLIALVAVSGFFASCDFLFDENGNGDGAGIVDEYESNDTRAEAAAISLATDVAAIISPDGDEDWFVFDTANSGVWDWVRFNATNVASELTIKMVGYDADGNEVFNEYANNDGANLSVDMSTLGGTYYVQVLSNWSGQTGSYTLRVENLDANDQYEPNELRTTAHDFGVLPVSAAQGTLITSEEDDWYEIQTENSGVWDYILFSVTDVSPDLTMKLIVQNSGGDEVVNEYAENAGADLSTLLATPGGTYFVDIMSNWSGEYGDYSLTIQNQNANDAYEPNDSEGEAYSLSLPVNDLQGEIIWTPGEDDWYTFTSANTNVITFDVTNVDSTIAVQMEVKEAGGASYTYSGTEGNGFTFTTDDSANLTPAAGETYYVRVGGRWSGDYGSYTVSISQ